MAIKTYIVQLKTVNYDDYQHIQRIERTKIINTIHENALINFIEWIKSSGCGRTLEEGAKFTSFASMVIKIDEDMIEYINKYPEIQWIKENGIIAKIN